MPVKRKGGLSNVFRGAKGGLSEKKIKERSGGNRNTELARFKDGEPAPYQFYGSPTDPDAFMEFEQHAWKEKYWNFVPCPQTDDCVLCNDEDEDKAKTGYAFAAQVWSFKDRKAMVISAGTNLAQAIIFKWKRAPEKFVLRVWDITRLATTPKSFQVDVSETTKRIRLAGKEPVNLPDYLKKLYDEYAKAHPLTGRSTLDDDDDYDEDDEMEDDEEDTPTHEQMQEMEWSELKRYAKSVGVTERITKRSELIDAIEEALEEEE